MIMNIDDEVSKLIEFLKHPAGFDVDLAGTLCIRPISENSPPSLWEVDWEERKENNIIIHSKEFLSLSEAARFFVEKRHAMQSGLDFEAEYYKNNE